ncbi:MAG: hypothetical protein IJU77_01665 [Butyrivibrio sp.]|jgi:hypothetical protein|nr:hypothetical protein [Butyrivibrio sp.]
MGNVITTFDFNEKRYMTEVISDFEMVSDRDIENMEAALIRFADELAIAN